MPTAQQPAEAIAPLPSRLAWFAPWRWCSHWKPWKRWMLLIGVLLLGYVLSPAPVVVTVQAAGPVAAPLAPVLQVVYAPLEQLYFRSPAVLAFYDLQFRTLRWLLLPPTPPTTPAIIPVPAQPAAAPETESGAPP